MKKKLIIAIILSLFSITLNSAETDISNSYFNAGGILNDRLRSLIQTDVYYKEGLSFINNGNTVNTVKKDVETNMDINFSYTVPKWGDAYNSFKKSVTVNNNPISAFLGLHIINSYLGKKDYINDYKNFSQLLYENEKGICDAYINYGSIYEEGLMEKKDLVKAKAIYEEGLNKACTSGWKRQIVESKLWALKG